MHAHTTKRDEVSAFGHTVASETPAQLQRRAEAAWLRIGKAPPKETERYWEDAEVHGRGTRVRLRPTVTGERPAEVREQHASTGKIRLPKPPAKHFPTGAVTVGALAGSALLWYLWSRHGKATKVGLRLAEAPVMPNWVAT